MKKKNYAYEVTLRFTGSFKSVSKKDCIEMIKDGIADETGICPNDKEIKIWVYK